MLEKRWAVQSDKNDIIDFIDYVFSKAHEPHDFATLLPKLYGKDADTTAHHFLIKEDGKILAAILAYPIPIEIAGERLMTIGVGSVSVHPRARGRGFMDDLLAAVDEHAKIYNADFAVLGGDRQRYGYYGYDLSGCQQNAVLMRHNTIHALRSADTTGLSIVPFTQEHVADALSIHQAQKSRCIRPADQFLAILRTWKRTPYAIMKNGGMIGFFTASSAAKHISVGELQLRDEGDFPAVLRLLSDLHGNVSLQTAPWHTERTKLLASICQSFSIVPNHMMKFYQPERVKAACRRLGGQGELGFDGMTPPLPLFVPSTDGV